MIYLERDYHLLTSPRFVHLDSEHLVRGSIPKEVHYTKEVTILQLPKRPDTVSVLRNHRGKTGEAGGTLDKET